MFTDALLISDLSKYFGFITLSPYTGLTKINCVYVFETYVILLTYNLHCDHETFYRHRECLLLHSFHIQFNPSLTSIIYLISLRPNLALTKPNNQNSYGT